MLRMMINGSLCVRDDDDFRFKERFHEKSSGPGTIPTHVARTAEKCIIAEYPDGLVFYVSFNIIPVILR